MATGIWDQTLFDPVQASVHECLKFSVVRDFCQFIAKRKPLDDPDPESATVVMLERYEGALHKSKKEKEKDYGTLRVRGPNLGGWLKKKSFLGDKPKDKKGSFIFRTHYSKVKVPFDPLPSDTLLGIPEDEASTTTLSISPEGVKSHRERLSQLRLQEQIQLLRTLHQHQHDNFRDPERSQYNTMEFSSNSSPATTLSKSMSMPSIIRGISMANFKSGKSHM